VEIVRNIFQKECFQMIELINTESEIIAENVGVCKEMVTKKKKKNIIKKRKSEMIYTIDWTSPSIIIAMALIVMGIMTLIYSIFFHPVPTNNMQCSTGPILSPNYIDFLIFGFGMIFLMVGIAMLYAGRQRGCP
jgi:hypothetical protein